MKIVCRYRNGALVPVDVDGMEALAKLRDGRDVMVEFKQARSPRHHRLFFALIRFAQMHCPIFEGRSTDEVLGAIKLATGHYDTYVDCETGKTLARERSIAFESMDQAEFAQFFENACNVMCKRWMPPGTTAEDVRRELIEMVDGPLALGERVA